MTLPLIEEGFIQAKVVAAVGGTDLIQFLAALATYFAPGRFE